MSTSYTRAESDVMNLLARVIAAHHPALKNAKLAVDVLLASVEDGGGGAVMLHGYPCSAVVRKVSYKNRVLGRGDAEIVIDAQWWEDATDRQREGLMDHELTHVEVQLDNQNKIKRDRAGRPKLSMRLHDWQLGGFAEVAQRYGKDAPEVVIAREFKKDFGQYVFDFVKDQAA